MLSSGIAGSYDSSFSSFLRYLPIVLQMTVINLRSHQQVCKRVPFLPHSFQHTFFVDFFDDGHSHWCEMVLHHSFDLHFSSS